MLMTYVTIVLDNHTDSGLNGSVCCIKLYRNRSEDNNNLLDQLWKWVNAKAEGFIQIWTTQVEKYSFF